MNALVAFAEHEFRLSQVGQDGVSLRDTLAVIERRTGVMPEEGINPCELPAVCEHVWSWFLQLNQERPMGDMSGPRALTSANLVAWMVLEQIRLEPWEVAAIRRLDKVALASLAATARRDKAPGKAQHGKK